MGKKKRTGDEKTQSGEVTDHLAADQAPHRELVRDAPPQRARVLEDGCAKEEAEHEQLAREILRSRRARRSLFAAALFGEPAWELLLEIFVADCSGKPLSVTSACLISDVPETTALRWLAKLEREGLVKRVQDEADKRRSWVRLTDRARAALVSYFKYLRVKPA